MWAQRTGPTIYVGESPPLNQLGLAILSPEDSSGSSRASSKDSAWSEPTWGHSKCIEHGHHHVTWPLNKDEQKHHDLFGCSFDPKKCSEFDCDDPARSPLNQGMVHPECASHGHHHATFTLSPEEQAKHEAMPCGFDPKDCPDFECSPMPEIPTSIIMRPGYHHRTYPYTEDDLQRYEDAKYKSIPDYWEESRFFWPSVTDPSGGGRALGVTFNIGPEVATNINVGTPEKPSFNLPRSKISTPVKGIAGTSPPSSLASGQSGSRVSQGSPPSSFASGPCGPHLSRASTPSSFASGASSHLSRGSPPSSMASGYSGSRISGTSPPSSMASGYSGSRISGTSPPSSMASGASGGSSSSYYTGRSDSDMSSPYATAGSSLSSSSELSTSSSLEGRPAPCGSLYQADAVFEVTPSESVGEILKAIDSQHAMESEQILGNLKRYQDARRKFMGS
ncbi:uncharacterized protein LOC657435 [Tribolium castaneum]|uniref:Uncharacterized protein n=1 Tax=Tribolium castaneum TaxID=7070 RepID=D6X278_TRICA|nr:hypothetical protein TcasGA2_TC012050 [Tribolium castaneum]